MCPRCGLTDNEAHRRGTLHRFYDDICKRVAEGQDPPEIAEALGISRQRAHQIVHLILTKPGFNLPRPKPRTAPLSQLSILLDHMKAGRWHAALKLAAKWQYLGPQKQAITRGADALRHPEFHKQLGKDPDKLVLEGIRALKERYWRKHEELRHPVARW